LAGAVKVAEEAAAEFALAMKTSSGFDSPAELEAAKAMLAMLHSDAESVRRICTEAIGRFGKADGAETFHWLLGFVSSDEEQLREYGLALEIRPKDAWVLFLRGHLH